MYLKITLHSAAAEGIKKNYITFLDPGGIIYVIIVGPTVMLHYISVSELRRIGIAARSHCISVFEIRQCKEEGIFRMTVGHLLFES